MEDRKDVVVWFGIQGFDWYFAGVMRLRVVTA
jgi:hypothetical protein